MSDSTVYRISSDDPIVTIPECNRIFEMIADRLDKIEGYRGEPKLWNRTITGYDIVFDSNSAGVIFKDDGNPPNYWRVTINSAGTLIKTDLGRVYR